jgi:hypothetical protein
MRVSVSSSVSVRRPPAALVVASLVTLLVAASSTAVRAGFLEPSCERTVDADDELTWDVAAATAEEALQAALDGALDVTFAQCPVWTVRVSGTFPLIVGLTYAGESDLAVLGPTGALAVLDASGVGGGGGGAGDGARILLAADPEVVVRLERLRLTGGDATSDPLELFAGGAVYASFVELEDVELDANRAVYGGAIAAYSVEATRVTFVDNTAVGAEVGTGFGGAVFASGPVTLFNATFDGNAARQGGSVWLDASDGQLSATFVTFASATALEGAHLYADDGVGGAEGEVVLRGSVLAGATSVGGGAPAPALCAGSFTVTEHTSSFGTDTTCGATAAVGGGLLSAEPMLEWSTDAALLTRVLLPASEGPLVDAVVCLDGDGELLAGWPASDQRGVARPQPDDGACDAGAVEIAAASGDEQDGEDEEGDGTEEESGGESEDEGEGDGEGDGEGEQEAPDQEDEGVLRDDARGPGQDAPSARPVPTSVPAGWGP